MSYLTTFFWGGRMMGMITFLLTSSCVVSRNLIDENSLKIYISIPFVIQISSSNSSCCSKKTCSLTDNQESIATITAQKMKFSTKDFFSNWDQIRRKLSIWSHLPKNSLMENFIFWAINTRFWWLLVYNVY